MNFFIAGAQRCGTSYLSQILDDHPEISMAKVGPNIWTPEVKYFLNEEINIQKYNSFFEKDVSIHGEKSVTYFEKSSEVIPRIKNNYPDAKIVICLRKPSKRAISNYFYTCSNKLENRTIEEVFFNKIPKPSYDSKKISANPFDYIERSCYINNILNYQREFEIHVVFFEEFIGSQNLVSDVYKFLGANPNFVSLNLNKQINDIPWKEIPNEIIEYLDTLFKSEEQELETILNRKIPW